MTLTTTKLLHVNVKVFDYVKFLFNLRHYEIFILGSTIVITTDGHHFHHQSQTLFNHILQSVIASSKHNNVPPNIRPLTCREAQMNNTKNLQSKLRASHCDTSEDENPCRRRDIAAEMPTSPKIVAVHRSISFFALILRAWPFGAFPSSVNPLIFINLDLLFFKLLDPTSLWLFNLVGIFYFSQIPKGFREDHANKTDRVDPKSATKIKCFSQLDSLCFFVSLLLFENIDLKEQQRMIFLYI